ncbi:rhodanese-like domain-containing protein [Erythrobacter crassostreae]|uniref:Rhodanese-like domain-containing protein n=1 Tax=Erythrobacter crassostreae TaxID=2828328 RepID=A0A9X1F0P1_9SPHN|nr:rhodanese-like domain-containing protein [Erythrobacter crassostrea]MBV7258181.1 rhodanese-like domain-containing protein [Erythrobacter crassostrea]
MTSAAIALAVYASPVFAQDQQSAPTNPQIDYAGFEGLVEEVSPYRQTRLLGKDAFFEMASAKDALILDTRSAAAFEAGHIKGAVNLPFSDFTSTSLAKVIGENSGRPILIYCNNNFVDDAPPVRTKIATLALNIPTFINLYGYGYTNIWELDGTMKTTSIDWVTAEAN